MIRCRQAAALSGSRSRACIAGYPSHPGAYEKTNIMIVILTRAPTRTGQKQAQFHRPQPRTHGAFSKSCQEGQPDVREQDLFCSIESRWFVAAALYHKQHRHPTGTDCRFVLKDRYNAESQSTHQMSAPKRATECLNSGFDMTALCRLARPRTVSSGACCRNEGPWRCSADKPVHRT